MLISLNISGKLCKIYIKDGDYMRKTRFFIMAFVLVGIIFIFSGCAYYSSYFNFECHDEYMEDKYIDLLIPFDETDELYTDSNHSNIERWQEENTQLPENSPISEYNDDGFRSILAHMKNTYHNLFIYDTREALKNYRDRYSDEELYEIRQWIYLPTEWRNKYEDEYGETAFLKFCHKYKKCRVAIFDKDGNIVQISKKIPLVSLGNFYLQNISYDVENDIIKPDYIMSTEIFAFINIVWLFSLIGTIGCTIILFKYNVDKMYDYMKTYKKYIIPTAVFNIPNAIFIITDLYYDLAVSFTIREFFMNLFILFSQMSTIALISPLINVITLLFFVFKQKRLKKSKVII